PMARPTYTYVLPIRLALALAFKQKVPELTITYEAAAVVIFKNCPKAGASPIGESGSRFLLGCASTRMMCHANNPGRSLRAAVRADAPVQAPTKSELVINL